MSSPFRNYPSTDSPRNGMHCDAGWLGELAGGRGMPVGIARPDGWVGGVPADAQERYWRDNTVKRNTEYSTSTLGRHESRVCVCESVNGIDIDTRSHPSRPAWMNDVCSQVLTGRDRTCPVDPSVR